MESEPFRQPFGAGDRPRIVREAVASDSIWRKRARVCALQLEAPALVGTEHGTMTAEPGDWIVTNHPDDDATSDVWPVSAARFAATYESLANTGSEPAVAPDAQAIGNLVETIGLLRDPVTGRGANRYASLAITKLEEALLWLAAPMFLGDGT